MLPSQDTLPKKELCTTQIRNLREGESLGNDVLVIEEAMELNPETTKIKTIN